MGNALLFVNWVFWAALASGTLLVVGLTELLGGTTRGYRLFMAWLVVALAVLLVASELTLPTADAPAFAVRRMLALAFAGGSLAYLVASLARWSSRTALAIGSAAVGLTALVVLAVASGIQPQPLFALQLVTASAALGAVTAGMLLGHWYLVTPKLSPAPLRRMMWLLIASLVVQGVLFGVALGYVGTQPLAEPLGWLTWLRLIVGVLLALVAAGLALAASTAASLQASTGLLYVGMAFVIAGSIAGASISYMTGVPV